MRYRDLIESGKWWDDGSTIRLYHGTSSQFIDHIREQGLQTPSEDLVAYALKVLEYYIPREQWTDDLVKDIEQGAARMEAGRSGDRGAVVFCFTDSENVEGYAKSYAEHGGEIAYDVFMRACMFVAPRDVSWHFFKTNLPLKPRFEAATPIVVEIEVPKAWCVFDTDLVRLRRGLDSRYVEGTVMGPIYDKALLNREVRVQRSVPPEMIKSIRVVEEQNA